MAAQPRTQPAHASERPGETDLQCGAYSSPPCFMHELDPAFLGVAPDPEPSSEPRSGSEEPIRTASSSTAPTEIVRPGPCLPSHRGTLGGRSRP